MVAEDAIGAHDCRRATTSTGDAPIEVFAPPSASHHSPNTLEAFSRAPTPDSGASPTSPIDRLASADDPHPDHGSSTERSPSPPPEGTQLKGSTHASLFSFGEDVVSSMTDREDRRATAPSPELATLLKENSLVWVPDARVVVCRAHNHVLTLQNAKEHFRSFRHSSLRLSHVETHLLPHLEPLGCIPSLKIDSKPLKHPLPLSTPSSHPSVPQPLTGEIRSGVECLYCPYVTPHTHTLRTHIARMHPNKPVEDSPAPVPVQCVQGGYHSIWWRLNATHPATTDSPAVDTYKHTSTEVLNALYNPPTLPVERSVAPAV